MYLPFLVLISNSEENQYANICEGQGRTITCASNLVITVLSATYGRTDSKTCRSDKVSNTKCRLDTTDVVREICEGNQRCRLHSSSIVFGDPCPGTDKYLAINYQCIAADNNECKSNPCKNNATCKDKFDGYICDCLPGYSGINCQSDVNECSSNPCQNNGTCTDKVNGYLCTCLFSFEGVNCQTSKNHCASIPCQHGGTCIDVVNGYICQCKPGYVGGNCEMVPVVKKCEKSSCENGGTCKDQESGYVCMCVPGYTGENCKTDINECESSPCQNGAVCTNMINKYTCACKPGYTGVNCETDINECQSSPCKNNGICTDKVNSYSCTCKPGYTGASCEIDINECQSLPCQNNATCTDKVNAYLCVCQPGYAGLNCQTDINECNVTPCQNGGNCTDLVNGYICNCMPGYTGVNCQTDIDECASTPCQNKGKCLDNVNSFQCVCQQGFNGPTCAINNTSSKFECGTPYVSPDLFQPRIVGGLPARNYSWPWIVQLRLNGRHECGGAIIDPLWVVTAKHCFLATSDAKQWKVYAGKTHKTEDEPGTQQERQAIKVIIIPNDSSNFLNRDVALLKVDKEFNYDNYVRPTCLPRKEITEADFCFVKGWGETQGTGNSTVLKQTLMPIRDTQQCNTTINPIYTGLITEYMFCAGFAAGGHDACQGDSGGPLDCRDAEGKWYITGIVSWGIGCAQKDSPGIYAYVIKFVAWIVNTIASG